jgi:hypothetical protein
MAVTEPRLEEIANEVYEVHPSFQPIRTIPRPVSLNERSPMEAALAVGEFLGAPQRSGAFLLERFEIDKEGMLLDFIRAHGDIGNGRWACGIGTFLKLSEEIDGIGPEGGPGERMWMSNTPQEMIDHDDVFEQATGRVLVHGLGLSCVVSGLLTNPDVEHIDVVELNPDIIAMVAPAYEREPRVTIHEGNCLTFDWPEGTRWNYVWHDIWAKIGAVNLKPETAENGISYGMLFDRFADRADKQGAWAFDLAERMEVIQDEKENARLQFQEQWPRMSEAERLDYLIDYRHQSQLKVPGIFETHDRDTVVEVMDHLGELEGVYLLAASDEAPLLL